MSDQQRSITGRSPKRTSPKAVYFYIVPGPYFFFMLLPFLGLLLTQEQSISLALERFIVLYVLYVVVANTLERTSLRHLFGRPRAGGCGQTRRG